MPSMITLISAAKFGLIVASAFDPSAIDAIASAFDPKTFFSS